MHSGPAKRISLCLTQDFARHRRRISLSKCQELQQVRDRIAFRPTEVHMRDLAGSIADVKEQRRDRVRNRRALAAQHAITVRVCAAHQKHLAELRRVAALDLEKQHRVVWGQMMRLPRLMQLVVVLFPISRARPVGDDIDLPPARRVVYDLWARGSGSTPSTRSSVDRSVRDTSDVTTMVRMKTDAILMPSGRSIMFVTLV
jgi:hypothetical protein